MRISEAAKIISDHRTGEVAIATMSAMTVWAETSKSDLDLCYFAPMGSAGPMGLGLALARPDLKVMVLDGDGCVLMNLGSLVTIGGQAPSNFVHFVFENGCYALSGMQPLPGAEVSLCNMARAAGIQNVYEVSSASILADRIEEILSVEGPTFVSLEVEAEMTEHLDKMVTPGYRRRTAREGWHRLHEQLKQK